MEGQCEGWWCRDLPRPDPRFAAQVPARGRLSVVRKTLSTAPKAFGRFFLSIWLSQIPGGPGSACATSQGQQGTPGIESSHHLRRGAGTKRTGEGVGRGQELGPHVRGSGSPSEVQNTPKAKSSPAGHPRGFSTRFLCKAARPAGRPLGGPRLCSRRFSACVSSSEQSSVPLKSNCCVDPGLNPSGLLPPMCTPSKDKVRCSSSEGSRRAGNDFRFTQDPAAARRSTHRPLEPACGSEAAAVGTEGGKPGAEDRTLAPLPDASTPYSQLHTHGCSLGDSNAPPLTHAYTCTHADTGTRCPDGHTDTCWGMHASAHTCFPWILTWLESWLPPGEERKSKEDKAIRVRILPGALNWGSSDWPWWWWSLGLALGEEGSREEGKRELRVGVRPLGLGQRC